MSEAGILLAFVRHAAYATMANKRRMSDLQQQLVELRARVARIHESFQPRPPERPPFIEDAIPPVDAQRYLEEWLCGEQVETEFGRHFETEKLYEAHRR